MELSAEYSITKIFDRYSPTNKYVFKYNIFIKTVIIIMYSE